MRRIYLDHAATTPVAPEVLEAMLPYFCELYGNSGSVHSFGVDARRALEKSRLTLATCLDCSPQEVVFTSGGTESNNAAIKGVAWSRRGKGNHIITSAIEHHAILNPCHTLEREGCEVTYLPVSAEGLVAPEAVAAAITPKTILISIMHANNEVGAVEPLAAIGAVARGHGICFHTDAVQTFGHLPCHVDDLGVDLLSASAHKLYGPKGVGLLYIRRGTMISPLLEGGGQEHNRRSSTPNVAGVVGFAMAAKIAIAAMASEAQRISALRDKLITGLQNAIKDTQLNGTKAPRLPNNVNIAFSGVEGEALCLSLDAQGIACSTGSACTSESLSPSHVLEALGVKPQLRNSALRFSLGRTTSEEDIDRVLTVLPPLVEKLRAISPLYPG